LSVPLFFKGGLRGILNSYYKNKIPPNPPLDKGGIFWEKKMNIKNLINFDREKIITYIKKYKYQIFAVIFVVLMLILWFVNKSHTKAKAQEKNFKQQENKKNSESQEVYVQVFIAKSVNFRDELKDIVGTVRGSSVELKTSQEERLMKLLARPGDELKKGQVIAELDHTRTLSKLTQVKIEYEKKKQLFDIGGISKSELKQTQAALSIAQKDYDDTFVKAPKDGFLGEVLAQEGEMINRQVPVAVFVSKEDNFFIETSIIESNISLLQNKQDVKIIMDTLPNQIINGNLMSISPEATTTSRMVPIRIELPKELNNKLRPGFSAVCSIIVFDKSTIVIPNTSIVKDKNQVYVVDPKNKAHLRDVKLGYMSKNYVEVLEGLEENDLIISNPTYAEVKDGLVVKYSGKEEYKAEEKKEENNN
jgi:multidrug efflux pump subunit AcrA (membrane-fusion protein)